MKGIRLATTILIIFVMIFGGNTVAYANNSRLEMLDDMNIYIDGAPFKPKEKLYLFNDTTLVPMRGFFEQLGAEVSWMAETQSVVATIKDRLIELKINSKTAKINGKEHTLVVEPKLINGTTYVPLRFIAEAFMYKVDYDPGKNMIAIIDSSKMNVSKLKVYESSPYFKDDYLKMEITNNEGLIIEGRTKLDKTRWLLNVNQVDEQNRSNVIQSDVIFESNEINPERTYRKVFNLKHQLVEGTYLVSIYFQQKGEDMYWGYYWDIPLKYEKGEIYFPISPVYEHNYMEFAKSAMMKPEDYLYDPVRSESESKEIKHLANEIIKGANSDYEKLLKINEWVAQNIFYNWDGYVRGTYGRTDAYGTLMERKSVCQGYAELTNALLRAVGIPSRIVTGYALGVSASGGYWDDVDHTTINHAWNEAFVDGRWVILDTTWNSNNRYENGEFIKGKMSYRYFDPSLEVFSYDHKIMD